MTPEASKALAEAGPWAVVIFIGGILAIALGRAILTLWREHLKADLDDRQQRDRALDLLSTALAGNVEAAAASTAMAAAWNERNKVDAERNRADAVRRRKADG